MRGGGISVDVDPLLSDHPWREAVPWLLDLFHEAGVRATFFVVGQEAHHPDAARWLRAAHAAGHEIANHSHSHPGRFSSLSEAAQGAEVSAAGEALEDRIGAPIVGFRAPAWDADATTFRVLEARGYRYDSSCVPTWSASIGRAAARWYRRPYRPFGPGAWGRAPNRPYRTDAAAPWREGTGRVVEIPVGVGRGGAPCWFTPVSLLPEAAWGVAFEAWARVPAPVWLLHAHDVIDATRPWRTPPLERRRHLVAWWVRRAAGRLRIVPLRDLADGV